MAREEIGMKMTVNSTVKTRYWDSLSARIMRKRNLTGSTGPCSVSSWKEIYAVVANENRRADVRTFQFHVPNGISEFPNKMFTLFWRAEALAGLAFSYDMSTSKIIFSHTHMYLAIDHTSVCLSIYLRTYPRLCIHWCFDRVHFNLANKLNEKEAEERITVPDAISHRPQSSWCSWENCQVFRRTNLSLGLKQKWHILS